MAEQNDSLIEEVKALLEAEPTNAPAAVSNIPVLREQLAILVSTGKCKEAIGANLSLGLEQVKRLDDKDVIKYHTRYETYIGAKTTDSLIDNFLSLAIKAVGMVIKIDDANALKNELKGDFIITKEVSQYFGGLALRYGSALAVVNAAAITAKHVDFSEQITEQSPVITEELPSNTE